MDFLFPMLEGWSWMSLAGVANRGRVSTNEEAMARLSGGILLLIVEHSTSSV